MSEKSRIAQASGFLTEEEIAWHPTLPSTNIQAVELLSDPPCPIRLVAAGEQTRGRGSHDRRFDSPKGGGVYMTYLHRSEVAPSRLLRMTPLIAAAVHRALEQAGVTTAIKWVNDLFLGGKKVGGILVCPVWRGQVCSALAIGVGINLVKRAFPTELADIATSIEAQTGLVLPREALIGGICAEIRRVLEANEDETAMAHYRAHSFLIGRKVAIMIGNTRLEAAVTGIDRDGALCIDRPPYRVHAGRVLSFT